MNKKAQHWVGEINDPRPGEKGAKRGKKGQINGVNWGKLMGQIGVNRGKLMGQFASRNRPGSTIVNEDNTVDVRSEVRK